MNFNSRVNNHSKSRELDWPLSLAGRPAAPVGERSAGNEGQARCLPESRFYGIRGAYLNSARERTAQARVVGPAGLEPATLSLEG